MIGAAEEPERHTKVGGIDWIARNHRHEASFCRGLGAGWIRRPGGLCSRSLSRGLQPFACVNDLDRSRCAKGQQQDHRRANGQLDECLASRQLAKDSF